MVLAVACSGSDPTASESSALPAPSEAPNQLTPSGNSPSFDLGAVMRQVHFAFRPDDTRPGWSGGHGAYRVHAATSGFTVTPLQTDSKSGAPVTFETHAIGRASEPSAVVPGVGRVEADGHLALERGWVVEHLRNGEEGVEQSFSFQERPRGRGDLVVRVRVSGQVYSGESPTGHHFVDPATGIGLRYGRAQWIDGRGETSLLPVRYADGELTIAVPEVLVEGSAYPAVLDPTISSEFGMDELIVTALAEKDQLAPDVVFDGTNYFVVWFDYRALDLTDSGWRIYATRVSPAGVVLDPGGIAVGTQLSSVTQLAVGFDGTDYLVVWSVRDSVSGSWRKQLRNVRVSRDGTVLGSQNGQTFFNETSSSDQTPLSNIQVAFNGTNYLVVWNDGTSSWGQRVSSSGGALNNRLRIGTTSATSRNPSVAFNGTDFVVAWEDLRNGFNYDIFAGRVGASGGLIPSGGALLSGGANNQSESSVACDGINCLIVWNDSKWGDPDIYATRVDSSGTNLHPGGIEIVSAPGAQSRPAAGFDGTNYVVVWKDASQSNSQIRGARISAGGALLDAQAVPLSNPTIPNSAPTMACSVSECLIGWEARAADATWDIWGARFSGAGAVVDAAFPISTAANDQSNAAVGWNGTHYLVVWEDKRSGSMSDIYGVRVSALGAVLDGSGIAVSTAPGNQARPKIASDGSSFFVVWQDERAGSADADIMGTRVDADGTVLDPAGLMVSGTVEKQTTPNLVYGDAAYLVAWIDQRNNPVRIISTRVTPSGSVQNPAGIVLASTGAALMSPGVVYDGSVALVVWTTSGSAIAGVRVSGAGTPVGSVFTISTAGTMPAAAFDGFNFLVVYRSYDNILGSRVTSAGTLLDSSGGFPISAAVNIQSSPAVAFDGTDCFVAWRDERNSLNAEIYGAWVNRTGNVFPSTGFAVSAPSVKNHGPPALASDGAGRLLMAASRAEPLIPIGAHRMHARMITSSLVAGASCSAASDCASGFCVDGVCCNAPCGNSAADCQACSAALGATADGVCTPLTGVACNDGNGCTQTDTCQAGVCFGADPVVCVAQDACHEPGTCNPVTGQCSAPIKPNGSPCDDGSACTQSDTCQGGTCTGQNPVICPMVDSCHVVAACDVATGICPVTEKPDGAACDDGNACTQLDTCLSGVCVGVNEVICPTLDACHDQGVCNPATGMCVNPAKPNGTSCDDGNACTQSDSCQGGACVGANPVLCPAPGVCHSAGICNPGTGQCVGIAPLPEGTVCDDGDPCTSTDRCSQGACGGTAVVCAALDECHAPGVCDASAGGCTNPALPDNTPCTGGICVDGTCQIVLPTGSGGGGAGTSSSTSTGVGGATSTGVGGATSTGVGGDTSGAGGSGEAPSDDGGCGCRTHGSSTGGFPIATLALGLLVARRRRQGRARAAVTPSLL
ncbi:MYXO-CTERM sorting domain-containing protein [Chondromyces crocatus]|uniref:Disintegrin domain-containing protein n=1 Tax=Chondromyces crocatus TaxID=52 RepID=A0A0K1EMC1_CHOCO|nr:MYXO-CTERM sorting domain-containing protein [Chondromyces crocatus]AKT41768.1 uncharacterized protein CMC5_059790 [Chondromyces crocatus]